VEDAYLSDNQKEVLKAVRELRRENEGPVRTAQVRERTGKGPSYTSDLLADLVEKGKLKKPKKGIYDVPEASSRPTGKRPEDSSKRATGNQSPAGPVPSEETSSASQWPILRGSANSPETGMMTVDDRLIRSFAGRLPDPSQAFFYQIEGDSMQPWLQEGDYVFALRASQVSVAGRYVVAWGTPGALTCVHLSPVGTTSAGITQAGTSPEESEKNVLQLSRGGSRESVRLAPLSSPLYEREDGEQLRMQIRGRVVWPRPTAEGVMETVTDQMRKVLDQAVGS